VNEFLEEEDHLWLRAVLAPAEGVAPAVPEDPAAVWVLAGLTADAVSRPAAAFWVWFERQEAPVKLLVVFLVAFLTMFVVGRYALL
jgi:hypothetical protein